MKTLVPILILVLLWSGRVSFGQVVQRRNTPLTAHHEMPDQGYVARDRATHPRSPGRRDDGLGYVTTQVNIDADGNNILGDAANEPSIAVDPLNPQNIVIGWRQFDDVNNNFRQAGFGYSGDGGQSWTFPGVIDPGVFRSDPVLDYDSVGNFFYNSLTTVTGDYTCDLYKSIDGGATWGTPVPAKGGDKQWMTIDRTAGPGSGNVYACWNSSYSSCTPGFFTRSADGGASFEDCIEVDGFPYWGTLAVGNDGELYISGAGAWEGAIVVNTTNAQIPGSSINWDFVSSVELDGYVLSSDPINPVGLVGQVSIDVDRSDGPGRGNVYVLCSVARMSSSDPADVMMAVSTDGGQNFNAPQRINADVSTVNRQWFGTMSVAPNGRIDVVWLDTRDAPEGSYLSALYYRYSTDQGENWSAETCISELFDPQVGYPQQPKMGDYFDMVSDNEGAHLAWANTLNDEQDVYYTRITPDLVGLEGPPSRTSGLALDAGPNPFRDQTTIRYTLPASGPVQIDLLDLSGAVVETLVSTTQQAGTHSVTWSDTRLPAGFYLCRLNAAGTEKTIRVVRLR
jgi:hypothetical protein